MDECKDILKLAAYDFTEMERTDSFSYDLKTFFLSESFSSWLAEKSSGFSIGLPASGNSPPLQLGATSSSDEIRPFQTRIQEMSAEQIASLSHIHVLRQIVRPEALAAWRDCMTRHRATDIVGEADPHGEWVDVNLRWEKVGATDLPPVVKSFDFEPLEPSPTLRIAPGVEINTDGISQRFRRRDRDAIILSLSTTRGAWHASISAAPVPEIHYALRVSVLTSAPYAKIQPMPDAEGRGWHFEFDATGNHAGIGGGWLQPDQIYMENPADGTPRSVEAVIRATHPTVIVRAHSGPTSTVFMDDEYGRRWNLQHGKHVSVKLTP